MLQDACYQLIDSLRIDAKSTGLRKPTIKGNNGNLILDYRQASIDHYKEREVLSLNLGKRGIIITADENIDTGRKEIKTTYLVPKRFCANDLCGIASLEFLAVEDDDVMSIDRRLDQTGLIVLVDTIKNKFGQYLGIS